jgi:cysteine-rich repeat protein
MAMNRSSSGVTASVLILLVVGVAPSGAQTFTLNKCSAGKKKCVGTRVTGLFKCHVTSESKGVPVDDKDCLAKALAKYDGGDKPEKGCFAKLEAKSPPGSESPCLTFGDSAALDSAASAFVDQMVRAVDPAYPAIVTNKCSAGKKKCISKKAAALLKCHEKSEAKGIDPNAKECLDKARAKFDGGAKPEKGCFAKLEAKGGCPTSGDTGTVESAVDAFVDDVVAALDPGVTTTMVTTTTTLRSTTTSSTAPPTTTTTTTAPPTTTTTTTAPPTTTTTTSSTTTTTLPGPSICGNGAVEPGEECDDMNDRDDDGCTRSCTICGNSVITAPETCDDGNLVGGDGCSASCTTELCGNQVVDVGETCDDGNLDNFDGCPNSCREEACTPVAGSVRGATVNWNSPVSVGSLTVLIDYPEGRVNLPGSGGSIPAGILFGFPSGTSPQSNDIGNQGYALRTVVVKATAITPRPGQLFKVNFEDCAGATPPATGDFTCTVESAFAPDGITSVAGATCTITVP